MLLILLTTVLLIWYLHYHWTRRHLYHHASKIPGHSGWPIVGNLFDFTGDSNAIFDKVSKHLNSYKHIGKAWIGPILVFGINKPEYLEKVLTSSKTTSRGYVYRKLGSYTLGNGLFTAPIPTWKRYRKIINPAFNQKILDGFVEVFGRQSTILGDHLEKYASTENIDLFQIVSRCTLDIACETIIGVQVSAQEGESVVAEWTDRFLEILLYRFFKIWYHFDFIFKWTRLHKETQVLLKKYNYFVDEIIEKRKDVRSESWSLLDFLLDMSHNNNEITIDEISDQVKTFIIAAFDSTAISFGFVMTMIAMHPEIQNRVHEEVLQVLGPDRTVQCRDLPSLKYTEFVIKESLRLFPPGPFMTREVLEDLSLEDDVTLPKDSIVMLGILHVHRNPEYWPEPLKFNPERFLPEEAKKRHPSTYLPFSAGPMNCIGQKYAMMSMKTMIATLIRRFKFHTTYETIDEIKLKTNIVLRPRDGFKSYIELRK